MSKNRYGLEPLGIPPEEAEMFAQSDLRERWAVLKKKVKKGKLNIKFTTVKDFKK